MSFRLIEVREKEGGEVTEITLKSPPGNVLTIAMMKEIAEQITLDQNNPRKKLIVFGAYGNDFSFGASIEEHTAEKVSDMLPFLHSFLGGIIKCPIPTLAKVSGLCLGGAFELSLACTFLCADDSANFGVPEINLGVFPPAACILLPVKAGDALAGRMILTGERIGASALRESGLFTLITEKGNLDKAVDAYFQKHLRTKSASSLRIAQKASRMILADFYDRHIGEMEKVYLNELLKTHDADEGIMAFLEKRPPKWKDA